MTTILTFPIQTGMTTIWTIKVLLAIVMTLTCRFIRERKSRVTELITIVTVRAPLCLRCPYEQLCTTLASRRLEGVAVP